jgi:hypothetical protein
MISVQIGQKSYEMAPWDGFTGASISINKATQAGLERNPGTRAARHLHSYVHSSPFRKCNSQLHPSFTSRRKRLKTRFPCITMRSVADPTLTTAA